MQRSEFLDHREAGRYAGPLAMSYGRISHADGEDGQSVPAQGHRTEHYYRLMIAPQGVQWGGFFGEPNHVSAWRIPFARRPAGALIVKHMRSGDHIIFDTLLRAWRDDTDFCVTRDWFKRQGIHCHTVNLAGGACFSWDTAMGDLFVGMQVLYGKFESASISERGRRANAFKREKKMFNPGTVPAGCQRILVEKRWGANVFKLAWDEVKLARMDRVVHLVDCQQLEYEQIADLFNQEEHKGPKPWSRSEFNGDFWTRKKCSLLYQRRKLLDQLGYPDLDPNTVQWSLYDRKPPRKSMVARELLE